MSFLVFLVTLGDIDSNFFFKNLQLRLRYFFWDALQHITRKKIKDREGHG